MSITLPSAWEAGVSIIPGLQMGQLRHRTSQWWKWDLNPVCLARASIFTPTKDNMTAATDAHGMPPCGHAVLCLKPPALLPLLHPCMSPGDRCPLASCCGTLTSVGSGSKSHPVCGFYSQDPEVREDEGLPAVPHRGKHSGTLWTKEGDTGNVSPGDMAALKARTG